MVEAGGLLYLDLMKRCLANLIYAGSEQQPLPPSRFRRLLGALFFPSGTSFVRARPFDMESRMKGAEWPVPTMAHTMIGLKRLDNLQFCIQQALDNKIPGDLIETGVWRGGATIFMRAVLKANGVTDRHVWVADSFQGLPPPNADLYPGDKGDVHHVYEELAVSLEQVKANFASYDLLDEQVHFLQGWFKDTLPNAPLDKLAVVRLDGDMYESTMDALNALYPRLSVGGYLIVDDYCLKPCANAVHDYREQHGITEEIVDIDGTGVYWQRER